MCLSSSHCFRPLLCALITVEPGLFICCLLIYFSSFSNGTGEGEMSEGVGWEGSNRSGEGKHKACSGWVFVREEPGRVMPGC